jgi:hypothetical protein
VNRRTLVDAGAAAGARRTADGPGGVTDRSSTGVGAAVRLAAALTGCRDPRCEVAAAVHRTTRRSRRSRRVLAGRRRVARRVLHGLSISPQQSRTG